MLEKIKELIESNGLKASDVYPGKLTEDIVVIQLKGVQPKSRAVTTHEYELQLYSKDSMENAIRKLQHPLFKQVLSIKGVGNPSLSVDQEGLKKYKTKDLKMMPYIYSIDVIG